eukprot:560526-Prorocentrum_minimum.AAC.1
MSPGPGNGTFDLDPAPGGGHCALQTDPRVAGLVSPFCIPLGRLPLPPPCYVQPYHVSTSTFRGQLSNPAPTCRGLFASRNSLSLEIQQITLFPRYGLISHFLFLISPRLRDIPGEYSRGKYFKNNLNF